MEENETRENEILNISFPVVVMPEDIDDIMCTALEGGITYWCDKAEVVGDYLGEYGNEQISRGGELKMHVIEPFDNEDTEWYMLTKEKFLKGLEMYIKNPTCTDIMEIIDHKVTLDACYVDADVADAIIQYALFEDVVFG